MALTIQGLTVSELEAMDLTCRLMDAFSVIIANGPQRYNDKNEVVVKIHALQHMIMSQAAARAHPTKFRLLGKALRDINEEEGPFDGA